MLLQILHHTPTWVFVLFFALLGLGLAQRKTRYIPVWRATALPLLMGALSMAATAQTFPTAPLVWLCWLTTSGLILALMWRRGLPIGTAFQPAQQRLTVPGSVVPLTLMMSIFFTKYAVGATLGLRPQLAQAPLFACAISAAYGLFSGAFLARAALLWRLSRPA